jgi:hypothetical protein
VNPPMCFLEAIETSLYFLKSGSGWIICHLVARLFVFLAGRGKVSNYQFAVPKHCILFYGQRAGTLASNSRVGDARRFCAASIDA